MRVDALGLFWEDMPKIAKEKKEDEKYLPPDPYWEGPGYLPFLAEALQFNVPLMSDMDLMHAWKEKHRFVFDIESYINYFLIAFQDVKTNKVIYFERIGDGSPWNDDPRKLAWIMENITIIGFNSENYDMCIAALGLAGKEVSQMKAATNMIIAENYKPWQVLRKLRIKKLQSDHIDIMEVAPLSASLKIYGGRAGAAKMQDLPFHPEIELSEQQIAVTRFYCVNDLATTLKLYDKLEKDIELREQMSIEYGVDLRSKSDAQIAEAVISHELEKLNFSKPVKPNIEPGTAYRYKPPAYMNFQTPLMKQVMGIVQSAMFVVSEKGSVEMPPQLSGLKIRIGDSVYTMGIGGLHSNEKSTTHFSCDLYKLSDHDVTSYYPFIIINNGYYPQHLGSNFLRVFYSIVMRRLEAKHMAGEYEAKALEETDPVKKAEYTKIWKDAKRTADSLKIVINGTFGKLGSKYSIFYSPDLLIQVTLTGQLSLLMLIEAFEMNGIPVVSANTDGIVIKCPSSKIELRDQILQWWQDVTRYELEASFYKILASKDVNNYFAVKEKGGCKAKGAYSEPGLRKNPTTPICADAVKEFLEHGTPLEVTIGQCRDVNKFISVRSVSGGAVAVTYYDKLPDFKSHSEKVAFLRANGWTTYGNESSWIKSQWVEDRKPFDKMVTTLDAALNSLRWSPCRAEYLGKAVRWYYGKPEEGYRRRMVYAKSNKKVPKSDGAIPLMETDGTLPKDLDMQWYISEAERILKDIGYPIN